MKRRNNGEGSFSQTASGKIKMRMQVGYQNNGNPKILTVTGRTRAECIRLMDKKKQMYLHNDKGSYLDRTLTLVELCQAHLDDHLSQLDRLKPNSADRREDTINNQISKYPIGHLIADQISPKDITDHINLLINDNQLSVSSLEKTIDVINAAYRWANNKEILSINPCTPVKDDIKARLRQLTRRHINDADVIILSPDEEEALITECHRQFKNGKDKYPIGRAVEFLLATGMRVGEVCALKVMDYNRCTNTLTIRKTRSTVRNRTN